MTLKKIALLTSGGDAPGMNAAIRSVVRTAIYNGLEVMGVYNGYQGLIDGEFAPMNLSSVGGILLHGGTILRTARCEEFKTDAGVQKALAQLRKNSVDGLIVIGGDGSFHGAKKLFDKGFAVNGVPATIDNDMGGTALTIGFDTACNTALNCISRLRDTASSHDRLFIVEVMGRDAGYIALETGVACGAEYVVIPETPLDINHIAQKLQNARKRNKSHSLIITAEGACSAQKLAESLKGQCDYDPRIVVLGHLLRGGAPTCKDAVLAAQFGLVAVEELLAGNYGVMVGQCESDIKTSPLEKAWEKSHTIDEKMMRLLSVLSI